MLEFEPFSFYKVPTCRQGKGRWEGIKGKLILKIGTKDGARTK